MQKKVLALLMLGVFTFSYSQQVKILNLDKPDVSFRGLSVVDDYVLWVSGSKGTIGLSYNGAKSFNWLKMNGYENRDFRAIYAVDHQNVVVVAIGSPGIILKTSDGGANWKEVYKDESPDVFMNAIDFANYDPSLGVVVGDPVGNQPYILKTVDGGNTWKKMDSKDLHQFAHNEAFFAASNSNVKLLDETTFIAVTGGSKSHILYNSNPPMSLPLTKTESATSGANGLDYSVMGNFGLIVGGDFEKPDSSENNLFIFELDNMKTPVVSSPVSPPLGYKSGVVIQNETKAISCGLSGVDITKDKGKNWKNISETGYHACKKAKKGSKVYLTGPSGRIGYLME